jgi:hypothetical protein
LNIDDYQCTNRVENLPWRRSKMFNNNKQHILLNVCPVLCYAKLWCAPLVTVIMTARPPIGPTRMWSAILKSCELNNEYDWQNA